MVHDLEGFQFWVVDTITCIPRSSQDNWLFTMNDFTCVYIQCFSANDSRVPNILMAGKYSGIIILSSCCATARNILNLFSLVSYRRNMTRKTKAEGHYTIMFNVLASDTRGRAASHHWQKMSLTNSPLLFSINSVTNESPRDIQLWPLWLALSQVPRWASTPAEPRGQGQMTTWGLCWPSKNGGKLLVNKMKLKEGTCPRSKGGCYHPGQH